LSGEFLKLELQSGALAAQPDLEGLHPGALPVRTEHRRRSDPKGEIINMHSTGSDREDFSRRKF
jgi:hypothetical protein